MSQTPPPPPAPPPGAHEHGFTNGIVRIFLYSNLPIILTLLAMAVGAAALVVTPREEDPQIVVPMVDVQVSFPGRSAEDIERLIATPLETIMHEIDGVEYVYSMSRTDSALVTIRFYVGEDRERSLVKVFKKIDENRQLVPSPEVRWVVKPVEIDDVPIVNLTLTSRSADAYVLRRTAEEVVARLAAVRNISRAEVVGGLPRTAHVYLDPERMRAYRTGWEDVRNALAAANVTLTSGEFKRDNAVQAVQAGVAYDRPEQLGDLVVGVYGERPVFLKDVADVVDGPAEVTNFVRHNWGPARGAEERPGVTGALVGAGGPPGADDGASLPAVSIAIAKKKGANAVAVS